MESLPLCRFRPLTAQFGGQFRVSDLLASLLLVD